MEIQDNENYEFDVSIDENDKKIVKYNGVRIKHIIHLYHNTIIVNNTGFVHMEGGGMVNEKYFKLMFDAEFNPCNEIRERLENAENTIQKINELIKLTTTPLSSNSIGGVK